MSLTPDVDHLYEVYTNDDILLRLEEWFEEEANLNDVFFCWHDYEEEVLTPTMAPVEHWKNMSEARKLVFVKWLKSKTSDPYNFFKWLHRSWELWYADRIREDEDD